MRRLWQHAAARTAAGGTASPRTPGKPVDMRPSRVRAAARAADGPGRDGPGAVPAGRRRRRRIFDDRALTEALDPRRLHPALRVRCGSCDHGIAFIALAQQGAYLVSANRRQPPKRRRGGVWDLADITTPPGTTRAFPGWIEDAQANVGSVRPTGERAEVFSGMNERRNHHCRRCGADYTHTNTTLLRFYLGSISRGEPAIRLG